MLVTGLFVPHADHVAAFDSVEQTRSALLVSSELFVVGAKIREALLLSKLASKWWSLLLIKDALSRHRRLLEMPVAEMVDRGTQEQAFPIAKINASAFERIKGLPQCSASMAAPKVAIELRILVRRLFVHHSELGSAVSSQQMSSL